MKMSALATLPLVLAACSAPPGPGDETSAEVAPSGDVGIVAPPAVVATPGPTATETAAATAFPTAFRGRWGMTANDCDPGRDDNKGLIVVSADAIAFYESRATIAGLTLSTQTRLMAELTFSGEGQTWKSRTAFELAEGGQVLKRSEETPATSYSYRKCAA